MGSFLDKPKTEKTTHTTVGNGLRVVSSCMQGWRADMEVSALRNSQGPKLRGRPHSRGSRGRPASDSAVLVTKVAQLIAAGAAAEREGSGRNGERKPARCPAEPSAAARRRCSALKRASGKAAQPWRGFTNKRARPAFASCRRALPPRRAQHPVVARSIFFHRAPPPRTPPPPLRPPSLPSAGRRSCGPGRARPPRLELFRRV